MKKKIQTAGMILLVLLLGGGIIMVMIKQERDTVYRTDVISGVIFLDARIDSLDSIDLIMCDYTYHYTIEEIKDTIRRNLAISDKSFPCPVYIRYNFISGANKIMRTDSIKGGGASISDIFMLRPDTVEHGLAF